MFESVVLRHMKRLPGFERAPAGSTQIGIYRNSAPFDQFELRFFLDGIESVTDGASDFIRHAEIHSCSFAPKSHLRHPIVVHASGGMRLVPAFSDRAAHGAVLSIIKAYCKSSMGAPLAACVPRVTAADLGIFDRDVEMDGFVFRFARTKFVAVEWIEGVVEPSAVWRCFSRAQDVARQQGAANLCLSSQIRSLRLKRAMQYLAPRFGFQVCDLDRVDMFWSAP